ncbi:hypothetical protein [Pontibacter liquoris]|uniref:hypothetical protein n=1 Tax=Pontibacter liquoris TaxID=2905677 RepID=UPI001FA7B49E|nr:hypothetical protein [Pontibacter liquoris]
MTKYTRYPLFVLLICLFFACSKEDTDDLKTTAVGNAKVAAKPAAKLDAPTLSCVSATGASITLNVTAGATGAPAGFSIQWMLKSEYEANGGWPSSSDVVESSSFCKASFSGVPGASYYNLKAGKSVEVTIGDVIYDQVGASSPCESIPLVCGQEYVFRAFAHNDPKGIAKSDFSVDQTCATLPCSTGEEGCTYTQGYWKTHGPTPTGNNLNVWNVTSLTVGAVTYTDLELQAIFNTPAQGNGLVSLAHQLIAAKLNVVNGANDSAIAATIAQADALIGSLKIPPVGSGYLAPAVTSSLNELLADYNEGATGPGHCGN